MVLQCPKGLFFYIVCLCCSAQPPCLKPFPRLHLSRRPNPYLSRCPSRSPMRTPSLSHSSNGRRWSAAQRPLGSPVRCPPIRCLSMATPCVRAHPNQTHLSSTSSPRPWWTASVSARCNQWLPLALKVSPVPTCIMIWMPGFSMIMFCCCCCCLFSIFTFCLTVFPLFILIYLIYY